MSRRWNFAVLSTLLIAGCSPNHEASADGQTIHTLESGSYVLAVHDPLGHGCGSKTVQLTSEGEQVTIRGLRSAEVTGVSSTNGFELSTEPFVFKGRLTSDRSAEGSVFDAESGVEQYRFDLNRVDDATVRIAALVAGNEASAISSLRTLTTVNEQYRMRFGAYAKSLNELKQQGYIDSVLGSGEKSGYRFDYLAANATTWSLRGRPIDEYCGRHFFVDESGVIRYESDRPATQSSAPVD